MTATLPSLSNLQPNPAWASLPLFDRTGWKRMAFGEFAESIGERAEPKDAQEEIYVGLEHLDPQCLHIRRWGKGSCLPESRHLRPALLSVTTRSNTSTDGPDKQPFTDDDLIRITRRIWSSSHQ